MFFFMGSPIPGFSFFDNLMFIIFLILLQSKEDETDPATTCSFPYKYLSTTTIVNSRELWMASTNYNSNVIWKRRAICPRAHFGFWRKVSLCIRKILICSNYWLLYFFSCSFSSSAPSFILQINLFPDQYFLWFSHNCSSRSDFLWLS